MYVLKIYIDTNKVNVVRLLNLNPFNLFLNVKRFEVILCDTYDHNISRVNLHPPSINVF